MRTHLALAVCFISFAGACAIGEPEEGPWGPLDEKADNMFGGQLLEAGTLRIGGSARYKFTGSAETPALLIHGREGQRIIATAIISNNAPPWLYLIDRDMEILAQSTRASAFEVDGQRATEIVGELPQDGTYYLGLTSTYSRARVKGATISVDLQLDDSAQCEPVTCELYCRNGFQTDENGCEICECK